MQKNATVDFINRELKLNYGVNDYGEANFRVVFSDDQKETRKGVFKGLQDIQEVKKYPWIDNKWILERWAPGELARHKDLVTLRNGVYICVYAFQDANFNYLPPLLRVCKILIKHLLHPRSKAQALAEDAIIEAKADEVETEKIVEGLKIQSDIAATEDPKASRESASVGYVSDKI